MLACAHAVVNRSVFTIIPCVPSRTCLRTRAKILSQGLIKGRIDKHTQSQAVTSAPFLLQGVRPWPSSQVLQDCVALKVLIGVKIHECIRGSLCPATAGPGPVDFRCKATLSSNAPLPKTQTQTSTCILPCAHQMKKCHCSLQFTLVRKHPIEAQEDHTEMR